MLPPVGGIIISDYFFIHKQTYSQIQNTKFKKINWIAIIAFLCGFIVSNIVSIGITALNSIFITILVYTLGTKFKKIKGDTQW